MPETDPGRLPTSKMDLVVTTINGPLYMSRIQYWQGDSRIYHIIVII